MILNQIFVSVQFSLRSPPGDRLHGGGKICYGTLAGFELTVPLLVLGMVPATQWFAKAYGTSGDFFSPKKHGPTSNIKDIPQKSNIDTQKLPYLPRESPFPNHHFGVSSR